MVLHYELRGALATCDYELQSLKHQYEALVPGKVCSLIFYTLKIIFLYNFLFYSSNYIFQCILYLLFQYL